MHRFAQSPSAGPRIPVPRSGDQRAENRSRGVVPAGPLSLLAQANSCLEQAELAATPAERYVEAHLASFRAATAVVLLRSPQRMSTRPASVWTLLAEIAPELQGWSEYFDELTERKAVADSGGDIAQAEAADLLVRASKFVRVAERSLLEVLA